MQTEKRRRSFLEILEDCAASETLKLPVFPEVASELQQLLANPDFSIDQVARVISTDQALATQIMRLANSGLYAGFKGVRTIHDAILRVGTTNVFNHVVAIKQGNYYRSSDSMLDEFLKISYTHAICTALGAEWLVKQVGCQHLRSLAIIT